MKTGRGGKQQLELLKKFSSAYGGELLKTRKGREHGRPLDSKNSMHLVLRASRATGALSFRRFERAIDSIVQKFAKKYGVRIYSMANVGNHLHLHMKLSSRHGYRPFVRAITGAIAMKVTGQTRWNKVKTWTKFWDYRPYTRVVLSRRGFLNLRDYIEINRLEGFGHARGLARFIVRTAGPPPAWMG